MGTRKGVTYPDWTHHLTCDVYDPYTISYWKLLRFRVFSNVKDHSRKNLVIEVPSVDGTTFLLVRYDTCQGVPHHDSGGWSLVVVERSVCSLDGTFV